jgi:hypothetical protein
MQLETPRIRVRKSFRWAGSSSVLTCGLQRSLVLVCGVVALCSTIADWSVVAQTAPPTLWVQTFAVAPFVMLLLIPVHIIWLIERRAKDGIIPTEKYFPGIFTRSIGQRRP